MFSRTESQDNYGGCQTVAEAFNSIQFILYSPISQITNLPQKALQSVHIPRSPSDQEKLPRNRNKLSQGKKGKKPSGEQQRRIPLPAIDVMCTEGIITE